MSRIPGWRPDQLDPEQAALYAVITGGPRAQGPQHFELAAPDGSLNGPFNALFLSPRLGSALQDVGTAVRYETDLSPRARELAILVVAAAWDSAFEWSAHEAVGRAIGLTSREIDSIRLRLEVPLADATESAVVDLCRLLVSGDVSDEEWPRFASILGEKAIFELSTLVGYYATLALQLRIFRADKRTS